MPTRPTAHRRTPTGTQLGGGLLALLLALSLAAQAQVRTPSNGGGGNMPSGMGSMGGMSGGSAGGPAGLLSRQDSTGAYTDTSAAKGLVYRKEVPDSVLKQKVFSFNLRTATVWIDTVGNPSLDPTGAQFNDAIDALNGNYFIGKGSLGHQHTGLFPTPADGLSQRLQPDAFAAYAVTPGNLEYFQTLTPFSKLSYGGSLDKDHSLSLLHTQNIRPGWNAAFAYRLLNPEGAYTSSGAVNHHFYATTNYFSADSRLQASGYIIRQSLNIDENGGLLYDSIFTLRLQSNTAGIPVVMSNAGTRHRDLMAGARASYSLERQSEWLVPRDSLATIILADSTVRIDTIQLVDTVPLRRPRTLNAGVIGIEAAAERRKRVFVDSTLWREQTLTLFWTNDAYADHRWRNPLKVTAGLRPHMATAVIDADTMRLASWLDPFARVNATLWRATVTFDAEARGNFAGSTDSRMAAALAMPIDSAGLSSATLSLVAQSKMPDARTLHDAAGALSPIASRQASLRLVVRDMLDLTLRATNQSHNTWHDTMLAVHQGSSPYWLLQAAVTARLHLGLLHLDMQQLLQHCTDPEQEPLPLWMSKNSLYADFSLFADKLRLHVGADLRYHTPYHAPLYHPQTGLFLRQDEISVGGYLWADAFVNIQVKRASIYVKAGHVNALWETPATYFLLPHYPGQGFGLMWGLTWCFFD